MHPMNFGRPFKERITRTLDTFYDTMTRHVEITVRPWEWQRNKPGKTPENLARILSSLPNDYGAIGIEFFDIQSRHTARRQHQASSQLYQDVFIFSTDMYASFDPWNLEPTSLRADLTVHKLNKAVARPEVVRKLHEKMEEEPDIFDVDILRPAA